MAKKYSPAKGIDFVRVLKKYLKNWWIFAIVILAAVLYARDQNKYIEPKYSMNTSILIEDKSNSSVLEERGTISANPMFLQSKLIENQIAFLKSFKQIKKIVGRLNILVSYYKKEKYIWKEIYTDSPFLIEFDDDHQQPRYKRISVKFIDNDVVEISSLDYSAFAIPQTFSVGQIIENDNYKFKIVYKDGKSFEDVQGKTFGFLINDINGLTSQYRGKTNVYIQKNTSILIIGTSGQNKQKEIDYLNMLTKVFLETNLESKNKMLSNTIAFVSGQLIEIGADLKKVEQNLEDFRKKNNFMQLSHKAQALLNRMNSQTKSRSNLLLDLKYYNYLYDYIETHENFDDIIMPSTVGLSLPLFSDLVLKLSTVVLEKEDLIANSSTKNPYIISLGEQISNMKIALKENMNSIIATTEIKIEDMEDRILVSTNEFNKLPNVEREYLEIQRKYKVFNTLYDFLLKRKSEVEIQRAANSPDYEVIDSAGSVGISNVSKSPKSNYINALIWAILLPGVFLFLLVFLNDRVMGEEDITNYTDFPIIGNIRKVNTSINIEPNSFFAEQLRMIRIKLDLDPGKGEKVVLVTSSALAEGKSFISENLALVFAMTGKKTLLMGFDLRRPKLNSAFNIESNKGITDYLINELELSNFIQPTFTKNLDVLLSGPIPPNPDELIESAKTKKMFESLKESYDYIVIDSPSIGLVGDAYLLSRFANKILFIIKHNYSKKKMVANTLYEVSNNHLNNISLIYNEFNEKQNEQNDEMYGESHNKKKFFVRAYKKVRRILIDILRKL